MSASKNNFEHQTQQKPKTVHLYFLLCGNSVRFTWLISCEGHRAAELIPVAHSGVTVHTDLIGAVGPKAWQVLHGRRTRGILHKQTENTR